MIFDDYLDGIHSLDDYENDSKTQDAIERRLLIIAEALYKLRRLGTNLPSADQIINRRNTIAHQYDEYNPYAIWDSIHKELPDLKVEVDRLLAE